MKIEMLTTSASEAGTFYPGDIRDVDKKLAEELIAGRFAKRAEEDQPVKKPEKEKEPGGDK